MLAWPHMQFRWCPACVPFPLLVFHYRCNMHTHNNSFSILNTYAKRPEVDPSSKRGTNPVNELFGGPLDEHSIDFLEGVFTRALSMTLQLGTFNTPLRPFRRHFIKPFQASFKGICYIERPLERLFERRMQKALQKSLGINSVCF